MSSVSSPSQSSKRPLSSSSASLSSQVTVSNHSARSDGSVDMRHELEPAAIELPGIILRVLAGIDLARPDEVDGPGASKALHVVEREIARGGAGRIAGDVDPRFAVVLVEDAGGSEGQHVM